MALDGITISCLLKEFEDKLLGGRIQKINQINKHLLVFNIYKKKNYKLLLSSDPQASRVHITKENYNNPLTPANFCMILRKHLQGGYIQNIRQIGLDRTLVFELSSRDELGDKNSKKLYVDLMGKYSNIVLTKEDDTVIEAIKRVSHDMSRVRAIYPGSKFLPLKDDKIDISKEIRLLKDIDLLSDHKLSRIFYLNFTGFSPLVTNEILYRSNLDGKRTYFSLEDSEKNKLDHELERITKIIVERNFKPCIYYNNSKPTNYYAFVLSHLGEGYKELDSISEALDLYYKENVNDNSFNQKKSDLEKILATIISKQVNSIDLLKQDIENSRNHEMFRHEADSLSTNTYKIKKGLDKITLFNYELNMDIDIELDPRKSVWDNINNKYKKSKKMNRTFKMSKASLPKRQYELNYLIGLNAQLKSISEIEELEEVKQELIEQNYLQARKRKKSKNTKKSKIKKFEYEDNHIYVGKNNKQNEELTLKMANKEDYFFHIKNLPGSHIILRNPVKLTSDLVYICSFLAAYYSKNSDDRYIDVDYCQKKYVSKPKGAKPGMVTYSNYESVQVDLEAIPEFLNGKLL